MLFNYIAFDLGAESGRTMLATLSDHDGSRLSLEEVNRFTNLPQTLPSGLHWNLLELWRNLQEGLRLAVGIAAARGSTITSLGVDTWGVDFGLLGPSGELLGLPYAYRDPRNVAASHTVVHKLGAETLYDATGIQHLPFNTLFQLEAQRVAEPRLLEMADRLLFMPDLLHYFFCGEAVNEATIASTSEMIDPRTGEWNRDLLSRMEGLPTGYLNRIVPSGTRIGNVSGDLLRTLGLDPSLEIDVVVPGSHDTASAVAAAPVVDHDQHWAYLSSGTWSLLGAELDEPVVTEAARVAGFTNERGVAGKVRFLKNIAGLWLVQQVRADFAKRGEEFSYGELTEMAERAEPFRTLVDPGHAPFAAPGEMCAKLDAYAADTGQPKPGDASVGSASGGGGGPGPYVRACLESLALSYRTTVDQLEALLSHRIDRLHVVGGGGQNRLLNRLTADALDRPIVVGPFEATAIGNALTQAIGNGHLAGLPELRRVVADSFDLETVEPSDAASWVAPLERFRSLKK